MLKWITIAFLLFIAIGGVGSDMGTGDLLFFIGFWFALVGIIWFIYLAVKNYRKKKKEENQPED